MNLKVKVYSAMPAPARRALTVAYIRMRALRERHAAEIQELPAQGKPPRVVYMTGFPRSGTTMLKYFFGSHPGLHQTPFNPVGFFHAWNLANERDGDEVLIDKSNHYIYALRKLFSAYGDAVRACVIVRDPRDCLVSCTNYQENREVPRSANFWRYWSKQHSDLLDFAKHARHGNCVHIVRYEDLVRFPEQAKAGFLQWLGFDVSAADVDRRYEIHNPGESWHDSVFEYREVGDHALQKWQRAGDLPPWANQILPAWQDDAEVSSTMAAFGYGETGFVDEPLSPDCHFFRPEHSEGKG